MFIATGLIPAGILMAQSTVTTWGGTNNYITKWTNAPSSQIGNSIIQDNGTNVGIGISPSYKLDVNGNLNLPSNGIYYLGGNAVLTFRGVNSSIAVGNNAGASSSGSSNSFMGMNAGSSVTTGSNNCFLGVASNGSLTGSSNTVIGVSARSSASYGTAIGINANVGTECTAVGAFAGYSNGTGISNFYAGFKAGYSNIGGSYNTVCGHLAGTSVAQSSSFNSFYGYYCGNGITTGTKNAFFGGSCGITNTTGSYNTFMGYNSGTWLTTGSNNVMIGYLSGLNGTTSSNCTLLGNSSDLSAGTETNATALGNGAIVNASNKVRIGNTTVTVVEGQVAYTTSDGRFKFNVKEEISGIDFIKKLRPVSYQFNTRSFDEFLTQNMKEDEKREYMKNIDYSVSTKVIHSGFIAQEVEKAAKECGFVTDIVHSPQDMNDNYSISYSAMVVPIVKAIQEQQKLIEAQQTTIDELKKQLETTGINKGNEVLAQVKLYQNNPNPFSKETVIRFNLPREVSNAYIAVYDLSGKQLMTLPVSRGADSVTINAAKLGAGMYIYSIIADNNLVDSKRMVITQN